MHAAADSFALQDDLAEHTVASPPPYEDENYEDWDRFDYWNDIESESEGFDDEGHKKKSLSKASKTGQKRKNRADVSRSKKKRKIEGGASQVAQDRPLSPTPTVLWRSRKSREKEDNVRVGSLNETEEPYALLKDWRERLGGTPRPTSYEPIEPEDVPAPEERKSGKARRGAKAGPLSPSSDASDDELEGLVSASGLDSEALKTALQKRLAEAGGPLEGFDQSLLLKYVMRMMTNEEASDDIAGELAEDMLNRPDDDPLAAGISSWLSQMGTPKKTQEVGPQPEQTKKGASSSSQSPFVVPMSPAVAATDQHPPTPSSTETNTSANVPKKRVKRLAVTTAPARGKVALQPSKRKPEPNDTATPNAQPTTQPRTRKRKAETDEAEGSESAPKPKRAARSYDAPTATSKAKAVPLTLAKTTRSGRVRRS